MKILIFSNIFYPAIGGIEIQTINLTKEFIKEGHKVKVITQQKQDSPIENIEIYHSPGFFKKIELFFWCNAFYMPNISLKGVWLLLLNPFKKWIISHNDFYLSNKNNIRIKIKLFLIKFAQNIAVSRSVSSNINTKSVIIYNCYDDSIFKLYHDERRMYDFVFVGRLVSQKGCDLLIKACKDLDHPFTLNIIGDGPEKIKLQELVRHLQLENSIKFLGFLPCEALPRILNRHRIMIIPSIEEEGFGIVVLEGLACGCKIIAADAGGLAEAVDRFGMMFRMGDQQQLSLLLKDEVRNTANSSSISSELRNYLKHHTKEMIAQKYLAFFKA
ncbi:MAG: glycosyltransferase family 4 protein [Chitinophagaceae bacterium]